MQLKKLMNVFLVLSSLTRAADHEKKIHSDLIEGRKIHYLIWRENLTKCYENFLKLFRGNEYFICPRCERQFEDVEIFNSHYVNVDCLAQLTLAILHKCI